MTILRVQYTDYGGEKSSMELGFESLTAANFDAWMGAGGYAEDMVTLLDALSLGNISKVDVVTTIAESQGFAGSVQAQREKKWFVPYQDSGSGRSGHFTIPCADLTLLLANSDLADVAVAAWSDFITELQNARWSTPLTGGNYEVQQSRIKFVGRNS